MNQELVDNPTLLKLTAQKTAFKEIMSPEKVAKVAYLIVQEEFSNMTGSLLTLDNGRSLIN